MTVFTPPAGVFDSGTADQAHMVVSSLADGVLLPAAERMGRLD
jgi:hypothetical protein